ELFFDKRPNIGRLILISYSPFEEFDLTLKKSNLLDKAAYKYFGFRHRTGTEEDGSAKIGINRNLPAFDSSNSLITSIYDDQKTSFIIDKVKKLEAAERALKPALGYDYLALEVLPESVTTSLKNKITEIKGRNYLKIDKDIPLLIDNSNLVNLCKLTEGVKFISNGE
ncbi:TPA: hypothetical protein ACSQ1O_004497, partial [Aeromonas hydrophila]